MAQCYGSSFGIHLFHVYSQFFNTVNCLTCESLVDLPNVNIINFLSYMESSDTCFCEELRYSNCRANAHDVWRTAFNCVIYESSKNRKAKFYRSGSPCQYYCSGSI